MAITFRDEKNAPLTHEELDANFRSYFFTASFSENNLTLQRKDGTSINVPVGGAAFADFQAGGGSIGNVFIKDSQITGSRMIIDLFQGQFYDKTKGPNSAGGTLSADEWYIDFDPASNAPYYVHFGANFAISSSGYLYASGAVLEGDITASSGLIGGFNITPDAIHGPTTLGTPNFFISGAASNTDHFISASNFSLKGSGDITGSAVLFSGGNIAGWQITNSQIKKSTHIVLDATEESISINNSTFGSSGIQLQYNSGTPRFYVGDGSTSFAKFDGTDISISTKLLEISASNLEISSTEASMSLGGGVKLLGATSAIEVGTTNKIRISGSALDAMIVAGAKTGFDTNDAGIILGMDSAVPTLDLTKDASNYVRFNTTSGVDIKTDTFKLDTTNFDIDTSTTRLTVFDTGSKEIIRLGEISDAADDLYGIKIFNGAGTGSANTIAMFGQQGNKIGGWEVTDSQIRTVPAAGFGENYGENETGLIIHSSGNIETSNFATGLKGWRISNLGNGSAEFENMRIRGTLRTTVFEKETVNVVGGQLMVTNATTIESLKDTNGNVIAGSSSYAANAVTLSLANVSGFEEGEILKVKTVDDTGFSVEYMYLSGSKRYSSDSSLSYNTASIDPDGLAGEIYVERGFGGTPPISSSLTTLSTAIADTTSTTVVVAGNMSAFNLQAIIKIDEERFKVVGKDDSSKTLTVIRGYHDTAPESHTSGDTVFLVNTDNEFLSGLVSSPRALNEGQVILSTGVYNPAKDISSGYILMNANPRDISTPYMDIVERTGSGVYDLQLKSRLGDLSGLSSGYLYGNDEPGFGLYTENGFFRGAVTAETGSIAGILHVATVAGGLETGQKISIGREVSGTTGSFNDGILVNNNNYWYTDGAWKVGGNTNFISLDNFTDGNLVIKTETFSLDTSAFIISSSLNNGTLAAGANASSMTTTSGKGVYIDGNGNFRAGTGTTGTNYIYWDGTDLKIKGNVDITGGSGATSADLDALTGSLSSSLAGEISASDAAYSASVLSTTDTLDGKIFTDSSGRAVRPPTASAQGLYMTSTNLGFYKGGEWATYMDSEGDFFLTGSAGNKLAWDSSTGTLEIKGSINITGGNAATQTFASSSAASAESASLAALTNVSSSLSQSISGSTATLQDGLDSANNVIAGKAAIFRQNTAPSTSGRTVGDMWIDSDDGNKVYVWNGTAWAATPDGTYDQTVLINSTSASLSSSVALDIFTDSTGKLTSTPDTSSANAQGLFLGDSNLGFYSASAWRTYMADNGNFFLTGSDGNFLAWDGGSLSIQGSINITGGNAATSTDVATAASNAVTSGSNAAAQAVISGSNAATAAQVAALAATNAATASLSSSLSSSIATTDAAVLSNSASAAATTDAIDGVLGGKNSVFRQNDEPSTSGRIDGDMWIDDNDGEKLYIFDNSATPKWVAASDTTYDQSALITSTSASLSLDIFTNSSGQIVSTPSTTAAGLYLGNSELGYYNGSDWATFMANNGNFFLTGSGTNKLAWDGGTLTIAGDINILGGNAATTASVTTAVTDSSASLATGISASVAEVSSSAGTALTTATAASGTATQANQLANTAVTRSVDAEGKITFNPTPTGTGLYMSADNIGFYDTNQWKAYISSSGDFYLKGSGNSGLSWDGTDLSVDGTIIARSGSIGGIELASDKIYIGTGTHNNANTKFYADNAGKFSLGDALSWDGTSLVISGSITVTNDTDFASQAELDVISGVTSSLANPTAYSFGPSGLPGFDLSSITPTGDGLYIGAEHLGFYGGNQFLTFMSSSGQFFLSGSGDQGLEWDGTRLIIGNKGLGPSLTYQFSGSLDSNTFVSDITTTTTYTTPVLGNTFNNDNVSFDEGFHSQAEFNRLDGPIFEWDIVAGNQNVATSIGLFKQTPSSFHRNQMHHAIYMHNTGNFEVWENGSTVANQTALMGTSSAQWDNDDDFSDNQQFRIRIRLLATGARYTVFKNGDFINPLFVYDSISNGITDQFVKPGVSVYYSSAARRVLFQAMAGGASLGNTTKIAGNMIQTGLIKSNNHSGNTDGSAFTSAGTAIDLDGGALSSTHFRITNYGNAIFKGKLEAATGSFTGELNIGSGNDVFRARPSLGIQLGHDTFASAPFRVTKAGQITATSGTIGAVTLGSNKMFVGGSGAHNNSNTKFYVDNSGNLSLGNKFVWDGSQLTIDGSVNLSGYATDSELNTAASTAATSASAAQSNAEATANTLLNQAALASYDLTLSSDIEIINRSLRRKSGSSSWNAEVRSGISYIGGAEITFKVNNLASGRRCMMGLNSDPGTNASYLSLDYAWYINGTTAQVYESGTDRGSNFYKSLSNNDILRVVYDGSAVKYYHNNILVRTKDTNFAGNAALASNLDLAFDSSFNEVTTNPIVEWFDFIPAGLSNTSAQTDGFVGGWTIDGSSIFSGTKNSGGGFNSSTGITLAATGSIHSKGFYIDHTGSANFKGLVQGSAITGSIIAGTSLIGSTIQGGTVVGGNINVPNATSPNFSVSAQGQMTASDASITGDITATSGRIGDWVIDAATNALRDDNSEIVFEPNIPELQMYSGTDKKVIISPLTDLTSVDGGGTTETRTIDPVNTTGGNWSSLTSNDSVSFVAYQGVNEVTRSVASEAAGSTFNATTAGSFKVTLDVPSFTVKKPSTTVTGTVSAPNYNAVYSGQTHGRFDIRQAYHEAKLYLCAFNSSNVNIGETLLGTSTAYGNVSSYNSYVASVNSSASSGGGGYSGGSGSPWAFLEMYGLQSVDINSSLKLADGSEILAKDLTTEHEIKAWDEINQKFTNVKPHNVTQSTVNEHFEIEVDSNVIKVSPSHKFWTDGNEEITVQEINPGYSKVYVDVGSGIELKLITKRELIREELIVVSPEVPPYLNYIANNIVHHNTVSSFNWGSTSNSAITGAVTSHSAPSGDEEVTITLSESGTIYFKYKWVIRAISGRNHTTNAAGSTTYTDSSFTTAASQSDTFTSLDSYDTSIDIAIESNFVEIKAGGIQVVSNPERYVRINRVDANTTITRLFGTGGGGTPIFKVTGSFAETDTIVPSVDDDVNLGDFNRRWKTIYGVTGNFSGNVSAFNSSDERLKENIINLDGSLAKILELRGTRFDWKKGNEELHPYEGSDIGFIAQEVKEVVPEVIGEMHGGYYGLKYEKLTPILVEAIKELSAKVDALEKKLESKN
ncbi:tail fiber domain-containing protein [bacterium]|nr:tail fiber domain-containing protein [bacterium]